MKMDYRNKLTVHAQDHRQHAGTASGDTIQIYKHGILIATILCVEEGMLVTTNHTIDGKNIVGNALLVEVL